MSGHSLNKKVQEKNTTNPKRETDNTIPYVNKALFYDTMNQNR